MGVHHTRATVKTEADDKRHKTKLYSKAEGPFEVIGHTKWNLTIVRGDGMIEQVTRNRASKAPGARSELYRPAGTQAQSSSNVRTQDETAQNAIRTPAYEYETDEERTSSNGNVRHPIERVRSYDERNDKFEIEWEGYPSPDEYTWEPPGHLHYNTMLQFFRRKKKRMPPHLRQYRARL